MSPSESEPPTGYPLPLAEYVWVPDRDWRVTAAEDERLCRFTRCRRPCSAEMLRGNGWWAYCEDHLYGRRIENGRVEVRVHRDSVSAERGYSGGRS